MTLWQFFIIRPCIPDSIIGLINHLSDAACSSHCCTRDVNKEDMRTVRSSYPMFALYVVCERVVRTRRSQCSPRLYCMLFNGGPGYPVSRVVR